MIAGETRFTVVVEQAGWSGRVDRFVTEQLALITRSQFQKRCTRLSVNGVVVKPSRVVHTGDTVSIELSAEPETTLFAEDIPLQILFEDDDVVVINKPRGMVVHPGAGNWSGTLVHALLYHVSDLAEASEDDDVRPGVVHRLDKETSGVLVCAKHTAAKEFLAAQFAARTVRKRYVAVVKGRPQPAHGAVEGSIARDPSNRKRFRVQSNGGKPSETGYRTLRRMGQWTMVMLAPQTGRTHQLRVHMAHLGTPILGDPLYSRRDNTFADAPLCLHALSLSIVLPGNGQSTTFVATLPDDLRSVISRIATMK